MQPSADNSYLQLWNRFIILLQIDRSFSRVKQLKKEVNHSPPSSAKVKNEWSYTSAPPVCVYDRDLDIFNLHVGCRVQKREYQNLCMTSKFCI